MAGVACRPTTPSSQVNTAAPDPYHQAPSDTLPAVAYDGWKQYRLHCDRCHGEDARGTSFGPDLVNALRPSGPVRDEAAFVALMVTGRPELGMPPASRLGLSPEHFPGLYAYLRGRSSGEYQGGRPARKGD